MNRASARSISSLVTMATAPGRRSACLVTNCCNNSAIWYQPVVSNERKQAIAVASSHVNPFRRAGIFSQQRSARRDKKTIVAGAGDHACATTCPRPGGVQEVRNDNINPGLSQMIDPGGDQRRRVRHAPETVRQRADLQVAEIMIVLHLLTRHDYPPDILSRPLSAHPESGVAGISRRINDVQSRGVRSYRRRVFRKRVCEDAVRPVVKRAHFPALAGREEGDQTSTQRKQTAQPCPGAGKRAQERRVAQLRSLLKIPQAEQRLAHSDRIEKERRQAPSPSKLNQKTKRFYFRGSDSYSH